MKCRFTRILSLFLLPALLAACTQKDKGMSGVGTSDLVPVRINAGIDTKAHDAQWDENDAIGLAMLVDDGAEVYNDVYNYHYISSAGQGLFEPASDGMTVYFPQDGSEVTFRSYYPYYPSLGTDMVVPINVTNQRILSEIDLMTAEHISGRSKTDPEVHLRFHHRLSKLIFVIDTQNGDDFISPDDLTLTIKGMKTTGDYELLGEKLNTDDNSIKDITVPEGDDPANRTAIVLPRVASEGVSFVFTGSNGETYTAHMHDTLNLQSGYQYTFRITLQQTEVTVSATVEPWKPGPTFTYDALQVSTDAGVSYGVSVGDQMNVYLNGENGYDFLRTFTYNSSGRWVPDTPVYWEKLDADSAELRASIIAAEPINSTQMADILIADDLTVQRNTGADFYFRHAMSKVVVNLQSSTFPQEALNSATITLPDYLTGATEEAGSVTYGTDRIDVQVDRSDVNNGIALIQPQTINAGTPAVVVNVNGRPYTADAKAGGLIYDPGVATILVVTLEETKASVSARVADWDSVTVNLNAVTIGDAAAQTSGVRVNEEMEVFTGSGSARSLLSTFTWTGSTWNANPVVYWDNLPNTTTFYASILRQKRYNDTQLDDYLLGDPVTVSASNAVNFELSHAAAKVVVQLTSSDKTFTDTELQNLTITLPGYADGATFDKGVFSPGTGSGDITVAKNQGADGKSAIALIQPQTIGTGQTVVKLDGASVVRPYEITSDNPITFPRNVSTILRIDLKKTAFQLSANVTDWEQGDSINLTLNAIQLDADLDDTGDFFRGKNITLYKLQPTLEEYVYSYLPYENGYSWTGTGLYWDDLQGSTLEMAAVYYPYQNPPTVNASSRSFTPILPADQTDGYQDYDILMSRVSVSTPQRVNFVFTHVLSQVRVELVAGTGFTSEELRGATVLLNNMAVNGTASLNTASVTASSDRVTVTPHWDSAAGEFSALVMPVALPTTAPVVTVSLTGYPTTPFTGILTGGLTLQPGQSHLITVTLNKTGIQLKATVEKWNPGQNGNVIIE